jgi:hypothetical protein
MRAISESGILGIFFAWFGSDWNQATSHATVCDEAPGRLARVSLWPLVGLFGDRTPTAFLGSQKPVKSDFINLPDRFLFVFRLPATILFYFRLL